MGTFTKALKRSTWTTGGSLENPSNWVARMFGSTVTTSGQDVNERNALYAADFLTCVRIISETLAQLPLILYERQDRGKRRATNHPLYRVLADQANDEMTAYVFRETLQSHLLTWGNAYAWIERNNDFDVAGLWPLLPDRTHAFRQNGQLFYRTRLTKEPASQGEDRIFSARDIFHVPGLSFDGLRGYSVVDLMREAVGLSVAQDKYNGRTLSNNSMPNFFITQTQSMKPDEKERFIREWREKHQGPDKAWAVAMLQAGMDVKPIGVTQRDAQFLELRKFTRAVTMGFFRIPPHMVSDTEQAPSGGTGVEARSLDFQKFAIQPWATRWEQQVNMKLLLRVRDQRYFSEFLMDGLLRGDSAARSTYFSQAFGKWLTADEIRDKENENPYEPPKDPEKEPGRVLLYPLNMAPAEQAVAEKPEPEPLAPEPAGPGDMPGAADPNARRMLLRSHRHAFADIADRILRREMADLCKRGAVPETVYADHETYIARHLEPALRTLAETVALDVSRELGREVSVPDSLIKSYAESYAVRHTQASLTEVRRLVAEKADLKASLAAWPKRAEFVAAHETVRAGNAFARAAYKSAGVAIRWVLGDECADCATLDGKVATDAVFAKRADLKDTQYVPASGLGHPPHCDGCECVIVGVPQAYRTSTEKQAA
ncbi:MAG: phage portal protein [Gemmatimonadaceae bacterium]|nr:phage portal protein [Gemmatimonadaceae bacterium]